MTHKRLEARGGSLLGSAGQTKMTFNALINILGARVNTERVFLRHQESICFYNFH